MSTGASPQPVSQTPTTRLIFNVEELCRRIARGKKAAQNPSVRFHLALRIASILLSSLGSVGVIVDKATKNLPSESGGAFWGSVILLVFGILLQFANEFQVAQRAADSRSLAEKCDVYDARLENVLNNLDPRTDVANMLVEVNNLFESERCNRVLPRMTSQIERDAAARAANLIARNQNHWQLKVRSQQGVVAPRSGPPAALSPPAAPLVAVPTVLKAPPTPPMNPTGDKNP
jgi:hypothetical protein